jgi:hypothetical protein
MEINEQIKAYLSQSNIEYVIGDYETGQPKGEDDQILYWNEKLGAQPTTDQLIAAQINKETADAVIAYKAKRAAEYPSIADQMDLLYHGGIDGWKAVIQTVKDKYPKG